MPSLDIVSRVDMQEVDNAVNNTRKMLVSRFDFRNSKTEIELDRKEKKLSVLTEDEMKMEAIRETFTQNAVRRGLDARVFEFKEPLPTTGGMLKREVKIQEGLTQDQAKDIVKRIKATNLKVQPSIQGEEVRLSGKKIDDLRACMTMLQGAGLPVPLQFVNMKS